MAVVSMSYLLEAGVHFGHQTKRWNPKMKEYIYNSRDDIYIIDLQKTVEKLEEAVKKSEEKFRILYSEQLLLQDSPVRLKSSSQSFRNLYRR